MYIHNNQLEERNVAEAMRENGRIKVLVAGAPGKMATLIAQHVLADSEMHLIGFGLGEEKGDWRVSPDFICPCMGLEDHEMVIRMNKPDIIVDFTLPKSVNRQAKLYCALGFPFVMGTTGGDRDELIRIVKESSVPAVIAPNMAKPIVAFMAMMEFVARSFPGVFSGYSLMIAESHQAPKTDVSGTAKALVPSFNAMGISFEPDQIKAQRDPVIQRDVLGVPEEFLDGHGWHTYRLLSPDKTVLMEFTHNVNGREVYALGALAAIRFLHSRRKQAGRAFSMIDVISVGNG